MSGFGGIVTPGSIGANTEHQVAIGDTFELRERSPAVDRDVRAPASGLPTLIKDYLAGVTALNSNF